MNRWQKITVVLLCLSSIIAVFLNTVMLMKLKGSATRMIMIHAMERVIKQADTAASVIKDAQVRHADIFVLYKSNIRYTTTSPMENSLSYVSFFTFNAELQYMLMPMPVHVSTSPPDTEALQKYSYVLLPAGNNIRYDNCELLKQTGKEWLLYQCKESTTGEGPAVPTVTTYVVNNSHVVAGIKQHRAISVTVSGAVPHAGIFYLKSGARLTDAIALAGGHLSSADFRNITISRNYNKITVNLVRYMRIRDPADNPLCRNHDIIKVHRLVLSESSVKRSISVAIFGAVRHTGGFTFYEGARLADIFTVTGGILPASNLSNIVIVRHDKMIKTNLLWYIQTRDMTHTPLLKNNDIVYVPRGNEHLSIKNIKRLFQF